MLRKIKCGGATVILQREAAWERCAVDSTPGRQDGWTSRPPAFGVGQEASVGRCRSNSRRMHCMRLHPGAREGYALWPRTLGYRGLASRSLSQPQYNARFQLLDLAWIVDSDPMSMGRCRTNENSLKKLREGREQYSSAKQELSTI